MRQSQTDQPLGQLIRCQFLTTVRVSMDAIARLAFRTNGVADANASLTGDVSSPLKMRLLYGYCNPIEMTVS